MKGYFQGKFKKNRLVAGIISVLSLLLLPALLFAQQGSAAGEQPKKYALVIGNGTYSGLAPLVNPVNDACFGSRLCRSPARYGVHFTASSPSALIPAAASNSSS